MQKQKVVWHSAKRRPRPIINPKNPQGAARSEVTHSCTHAGPQAYSPLGSGATNVLGVVLMKEIAGAHEVRINWMFGYIL
jgi:hypothetical protein